MKPSPFQQAIFDHIAGDNGNLMVEAVAGSGKTTTIVKALDSTSGSANFVAFNKRIAEELQTRVPSHVNCSTLHSYGFGLIKRTRGKCRVDKYKVPNTVESVFGKRDWGLANPICKIISLMKSAAMTEFDHTVVDDIMDNFLIEEPTKKEHAGWRDILEKVWYEEKEVRNVDFDDMIYIPVADGYEPRKDDWVFVDEVQDLNMAQMLLVQKMASRIVAVGDSKQAIYGFRGADADAMANFRTMIGATELPLSICYRCGKNIVEAAKQIVPHIEAWPEANDGQVIHGAEPAYEAGDYVVCRTTAPLVSECLGLLADGKKAVILGREIGDNLVKIAKKVGGSTASEFTNRLADYDAKQREKFADKPNKMQNHQDTVAALQAFDGNANEICQQVAQIFSDSAKGITLCTVHKSKGLEAENVWILRPDLLPHPRAELAWQIEQEQNLHYVAITRAQENLYYVG